MAVGREGWCGINRMEMRAAGSTAGGLSYGSVAGRLSKRRGREVVTGHAWEIGVGEEKECAGME